MELDREGLSQPGSAGARAVVALKAKREHHRTLHHARVRGAVWEVACLAAVDTNGGVLEDEGAALLHMASQASLFVEQALGDHGRAIGHAPGGRKGAVRIVAIGALHEPFVDAMFEGHRELRADVRMAAVAEVALLMSEEPGSGCGGVNGVARHAGHAGLRMLGAADIGAIEIGSVAGEATIENLAGGTVGEGEDGLLRGVLDMVAGGPMTAFAAGVRLLAVRREGAEVRVGVEGFPDVRVAAAARLASDVIGRVSGDDGEDSE